VPAATWLFLTLALLRLTRLITAASWLRSFAVLLPIAYLFSDYSENIAIVAMVWHFPSRPDGVAAVANALWIAKTVTSDLAACVLLFGVMARLVWLCLTSRGWLPRIYVSDYTVGLEQIKVAEQPYALRSLHPTRHRAGTNCPLLEH
jgi:hypothetical protein